MFGSRKKEAKFKFDLGDLVEDKITGFKGIVTCRSQWLHNCHTYSVKPTELKDGIPQDAQGFDEPQLAIAKKEAIKKPKKVTGGPRDVVKRANRI